MEAFSWEQAREKAIALSHVGRQPVHVVMVNTDYFVIPAADLDKYQGGTPEIVFTARPSEETTPAAV